MVGHEAVVASPLSHIRLQLIAGLETQVLTEGDRAYEVVRGVVTLNSKGQTCHQTGVLTFALQKAGED
jgi:hypothetical protein